MFRPTVQDRTDFSLRLHSLAGGYYYPRLTEFERRYVKNVIKFTHDIHWPKVSIQHLITVRNIYTNAVTRKPEIPPLTKLPQ